MNIAKDIIKTFFKYSTAILFVSHNNKVTSYIKKIDINQILSDIETSKKEEAIPLHPINSLENILEMYEKYAQKKDDKFIIPVLNIHYEFIGLWSRTDMIQNYQQKESLSHDTSPQAEEQSLNKEKFILNIMEMLPIPMLALDTKGGIIFYNMDWETFQKKITLPKKSEPLLAVFFKEAKKLIGKETINKKIKKKTYYHFLFKKKVVFVRLIINNEFVTPIGYLFWVVPQEMLQTITRSQTL